MRLYKLKESAPEMGDETSKNGINYTVTDVDKETNSISWKVDYETDFILVYKKITEALNGINELRVEIDNGSIFNEVMSSLEKAKYSYRKILKKDYPKSYKKLLSNKLQEISTSGGAGPIQGKVKTYRLKEGFFSKNKKQDPTESELRKMLTDILSVDFGSEFSLGKGTLENITYSDSIKQVSTNGIRLTKEEGGYDLSLAPKFKDEFVDIIFNKVKELYNVKEENTSNFWSFIKFT